jgi:hypothetical protein
MASSSTKPRDVIGASLRYRVDPRCVPPAKAARRLGLALAEFDRLKPVLFAQGLPQPDAVTGLYDLVAIDRWLDARSGLGEPLTAEPKPSDAANGFADRLARLRDGQR